MGITSVYVLLDGIEVKQPFTICMPQGLDSVVARVAFAPCKAPKGAWREFNTDLGETLAQKFVSGDDAAAYIFDRLGMSDVNGNKLRVLDPPPDELGLSRRGVVRADCRESASVDEIPAFVEHMSSDLEPLRAILAFAQRRRCCPRDMVVVKENSLICRVHETRIPVTSPARSYGSLVDTDSLQSFLEKALATWAERAERAPQTCKHIWLAIAYHSLACAQRAVPETRFLEHYTALDIVTALMAGEQQKGQKGQFEAARQQLITAGWPECKVPSVCEIQQAYKIRNDLAHARQWKTLVLSDNEGNTQKILRATEHVVTFLEECLLKILGFGGTTPPHICVSLPFRMTGWAQRFSVGTLQQ